MPMCTRAAGAAVRVRILSGGVVTLALVLAFLSPVSGRAAVAPTGGRHAPVVIRGAGATSWYPLSVYCASRHLPPGSNSSYRPVGSTLGLLLLQSGQVGYAVEDWPRRSWPSRSEVKAFNEQPEFPDRQSAIPNRAPPPADMPPMPPETGPLARPFVIVPVTGQSVALFYNLPGLGARLRLTGPVIADIYLGRIKRWNDPRLRALNPSARLPHLDIDPYHLNSDPGTTLLFTRYLSSVSPRWRATVGSGLSCQWPTSSSLRDSTWVQRIDACRGSIAYARWIPVPWLYPDPCALVQNDDGRYVGPSVTAVSAALDATASRVDRDIGASVINAPGRHSYPIIGYSYLVLPSEVIGEAKRRELVRFADYFLGPGQKVARKLGFLPIPLSAARLGQRLIGKITTLSGKL